MAAAVESSEQVPVRINGALMGNYLNSKAVLIGFLQKLEPDGKKATIKTTDDQFIQVVFKQPITFNLEPNSVLEVFGTVSNRNQFSCDHFTHFSPDSAEKFDSAMYNKFVGYYLKHLNRVNITSVASEDDPNAAVIRNPSNTFVIDWSLASREDGDEFNESIVPTSPEHTANTTATDDW